MSEEPKYAKKYIALDINSKGETRYYTTATYGADSKDDTQYDTEDEAIKAYIRKHRSKDGWFPEFIVVPIIRYVL